MSEVAGDLYGGIEAGGTKFVCAVGSGPGKIVAEVRFPTTSPDETLTKVVRFFEQETKKSAIKAIGIAAFGPLDPKPASLTYGYITTTPKPGWANTDIGGLLYRHFYLPIGFDTDVNGAALGEYTWGVGQGLDSVLYLTVGTGIGGGAIADGKIVHGLLHPEMGHIRIPHDWNLDGYRGFCTYHGDCFEGLACGPAIKERWGIAAEELPNEHPGWKLEAHYLALALANYTFVLSPQRLILGGGVMEHPGLFEMIRIEYAQILNGYIQRPEITARIADYIVPPGLGNQAGVLGAIALAKQVGNASKI
jgi:fructokinase